MSDLRNRPLEWDLLASVIASPAVLPQVVAEVEPDDFAHEDTRSVFLAMLAVQASGTPLDAPMVATELRRRGANGGVLAALFAQDRYMALAMNAPLYAQRVRALAVLRSLRDIGHVLVNTSEGSDPTEVAEVAQGAIRRAAEHVPSRDVGPADLTDETVAGIEADAQRSRVIATGVPTLDRLLDGGLLPAKLYVIGARPSIGKSALATNIVRRALDSGYLTLFASLEMTGREVLTRMLIERYDLRKVPAGDPRHPEYVRKLVEHMGSDEVQAWPLRFMKLATVETLSARARECRPALIVLDYLQLLPATGRAENRQLEVSGFTRSLKMLAVELECPVLALSQLNRQPDSRKDGRPRLSDLRESGSIENDADAVILLHRDVDRGERDAEAAVAKNRDGATGTVPLSFDGNRMRFVEIEMRRAG